MILMGNVIINIGRQFGSGGAQIARTLGDKLGIPVYDKDLLAKASEHSGFSTSLFEKADERRRFWGIGNIFGANRYGGAPSSLNDAELFKIQSQVIRNVALEGNAIFIGRASDYVLRDLRCLDIFICAPLSERMKRVSSRENVPEDKLEQYVNRRDKERAEYYNFFTFGHWGKASNYDLCIDSSILGLEGTADFIIEFAKKSGLI